MIDLIAKLFSEDFPHHLTFLAVDRLGERAIEIFTGLEDGEPWETDFIE